MSENEFGDIFVPSRVTIDELIECYRHGYLMGIDAMVKDGEASPSEADLVEEKLSQVLDASRERYVDREDILVGTFMSVEDAEHLARWYGISQEDAERAFEDQQFSEEGVDFASCIYEAADAEARRLSPYAAANGDFPHFDGWETDYAEYPTPPAVDGQRALGSPSY